MNKCKNPECANLTDNPRFCSRSCAAIVNNKKFPKRIRQKYFCKICGVELPPRRTLCDEHNPQKIDWSKITLADVMYSHESGYGASNRYTRIRDNAQVVYRNSGRPNQCERCSYKYHYHVCHIKPIHMFDPGSPISDINNLDNLMALCPNCHWELDNGLFAPTRYRA